MCRARRMYASLQLPWSASPSRAEILYRDAGLVKTQGSVFLLPPDQDSLVRAFEAPPRPKTRMSSGAVALCKHFERGGASSEHDKTHPFWPLPVGSNENKTRLAAETLEKMLCNAAWKNMMMLHPGVAVYEIRNELGYGMRWTLDLQERSEVSEASDNLPSGAEDNPQVQTVRSDAEKEWEIVKISFRGFLEPIIGMDHELSQKPPEKPETSS